MAAMRWYAPVDPKCPEVQEFEVTVMADPITHYSGCEDEISYTFERRHRKSCGRCREFGLVNIEVTEVV